LIGDLGLNGTLNPNQPTNQPTILRDWIPEYSRNW